jgi:hypothetical protein
LTLSAALGGLILWVHNYGCSWSKPDARLPEGSTRWPALGETISFPKIPAMFASSHFKRYTLFYKHFHSHFEVVGWAITCSPQQFHLQVGTKYLIK